MYCVLFLFCLYVPTWGAGLYRLVWADSKGPECSKVDTKLAHKKRYESQPIKVHRPNVWEFACMKEVHLLFFLERSLFFTLKCASMDKYPIKSI